MADIFPESREEEILVSTIDGEEYNKAPESRIEALLLELKEVIEEGGGGGGTTNYNLLQNKPSINSVTLTGDKSSADLGIPTDADLAGKQDALPVTASGNDVAFNGDIQDGQGNTLSVLAEALTKTASGNPVVFSDCAGGKARSLKTTINAIQDLHGYDHPWAGGGGKNKLPQTVARVKAANTDGTWTGNVYAINNGTIEILIDNDSNIIGYKVNGTFNAATIFKVGMPTGGNILNGCPSGGSWESYLMYQNNGAVDSGSGGSGVITTANVVISVASGYTASNLIFRPMTRAADASADFEPWENKCPISGRTAVAVDDVGKNQLPLTVAGIKAANVEGTWDGNIFTAYGCTYEIITNNELVTGILVKGTSTVNMSFWLGVFNYKANDTLKINSGVNTGNDNIFFRISGSGKYVYTIQATSKGSDTTYTGNADVEFWGNIRIGSGIALPSSGLLFKPSLVFGTESTAFEPYQYSSATIQLGTTVYGADINWDDGTADLLTAMIALNSKSWGGNNGSFYTSNPVADIKCNDGRYDHCISDRFMPENQPTLARLSDGGMSVDNSGYIQIKSTAYSTASDFVTAMGDAQILYELATPTTIQLTPTQLELLKGVNRVTVESGTITLDYIAKAISGNDEEIAPLVGDKATKSYAVNDFIERADGLYRVTAPIASGSAFTANNTVKMSIGEALTYLYNK